MDETCFPFATLLSVICCCQAQCCFFLMTFQGKLPSSLQTDSNATLVFTERNLYIFLCTVLPLLEINIEAFDLRYQRVYLSAINYFRIMQKSSIHEISLMVLLPLQIQRRFKHLVRKRFDLVSTSLVAIIIRVKARKINNDLIAAEMSIQML